MRWTHSCPYCHAELNPDEAIVLIGECDAVRGLVGLHPHPGNYKAYLPPDFKFVNGTKWSFRCPVCREDLASQVADGMCAIDCACDGKKSRVYFSRVAGEQATFVIRPNGHVERHGCHAEDHSLDLLGLL